MAGIYIHVPFCGYACSYCDFYFTTHLHFKQEYIQALVKEIELRNSFINEPINTLYFGGGTPSKLTHEDYQTILKQLHKTFDCSNIQEFTIEANPDDIQPKYVEELNKLGINRVSLGVQSFHDEDLKLMGRKHSGKEAKAAIECLHEGGIANFSVDLIYGLPNSNLGLLKENLVQLCSLDPNHISAYCLTIEPGTKLAYQVQKGRLQIPEDESVVQQFELIRNHLNKAGYEHYEISNWAKPKALAVHNTSYWQGESYLGLGPSAHSFNGTHRFINLANTKQYVSSINSGHLPMESESLSPQDHFNEYVMTRLRTKWGVDLDLVQTKFGTEKLQYLISAVESFIVQGQIDKRNHHIYLTQAGMLISDKILTDLFWVD